MHRTIGTRLGMLICLTLCYSNMAEAQTVACERWQEAYDGADGAGKEVVAHWSFDGQHALVDTSSHHWIGKLEGAELEPKGKFGGALRCFPGWPIADERHRMVVADRAELTPSSAFTLEMWICPDESFSDYPEAFLLDKKYVADTDYQLTISAAAADQTRRLRASLGFGTRSETWYSEPVSFPPGGWAHVAFSYDGAGTGAFFVNGQARGRRYIAGPGSVAGGRHPLSIGDRVGSYYHGFPGAIDEVRISDGAREYRALLIELPTDRHHFVRSEPDAVLQFRVQNISRTRYSGLSVEQRLSGVNLPPVPIESLESGAQMTWDVKLDTWLRPDKYVLRSLVRDEEDRELSGATTEITIVGRTPPHRFPVVMWGAGLDDAALLRQIGFTHALGVPADYGWIMSADPVTAAPPERVTAVRRKLDQALGEGITYAASLSPGSFLRKQAKYRRIDRSGKVNNTRPDICGLIPDVGVACKNVGMAVARSYGDLPAFGAALLHTEVRDAAQPCFHHHDLLMFRKFSGRDIPPEVTQKWGVDYHRLAKFPADRVIADDDPLYQYFKWYWKQGDGWNGLNAMLHEGLEQMNRPEFWTWHDPAVRVASVYGAGGPVDVLSQWTYSYPDPIRIAVATDELLAMAAGSARHQRVMKMTQVIWYRSQTAPAAKVEPVAGTYRASWEREQPDAPFITIAPMHLREALWTKISRPIKGIMYHGWQSLVPTESPSGYRYTNPATRYELERLIKTIVRPLGPLLSTVAGRKSDIGYYESFSSQMFARRGTYGWGGKWLGDAYQMVLWAGLQPEIVFDETVQQRGLDQFKILFMMDCDVLLASVANRIRSFQSRGGIVIGDDHLSPAIKPDIVIKSYRRTGPADKDKRALQQLATQLRGELKGRYVSAVDSSNRDVIPYLRHFQQADYLFLVNDRRTYGTYVGQHGLVMEDGLPSQTTIKLNREEPAFVYDLVRHRPVNEGESNRPVREFSLTLGPCSGRLFMLSPVPLGGVRIRGPQQARQGDRLKFSVEVVDTRGGIVPAAIPLAVRIEDGQGQMAEWSGAWVAEGGKLTLPLDVAANDRVGTWTIHVTELASGRGAEHFVDIQNENNRDGQRRADPSTVDPVQPRG